MIIKRSFIVLILALSFISSCLGQKVIMLTKQNGVYTIPCVINGIKRSLVFDTGASTVTISMELAESLYNAGKIKDADFKGFGKSQTASGHIVDNMAVLLRDVEISGLHLKNVDATILKGQNVPLLLGLSAIQKLGKVTLAGNKLIIDGSILSNPEINLRRNQISSHIANKRYNDAILLLKQIEAQDAVEEIDIFNLVQCYCHSEDYDKTLIYCQQWMGTYKGINTSHEPDICYYMALAYKELKCYHAADKWFAQAINLVGLNPIEETCIEDAQTLSYYYYQKSLNYLEAEAYELCVEAMDIAIQYRMKVTGKTVKDICMGRVKDDRLGALLYSISTLYGVFIKNEAKAERYAILAALCGDKEAIDMCEALNIDYSPFSE